MLEKEQIDYGDYASKLLMDMERNHMGVDKISTILVGEPGTGKTSFVKFFSKLVGLPLVLIEVPHISEEHLINIPFLVIDKNSTKINNEIIESEFKLVRVKSVLATVLGKLRPYSENEHQKQLEEDNLLLSIYEKNKKRIKDIRENFNSIMFFDEFYRARNTRITNILRTFLNGKIGMDDIPNGVYTVYASNMNNLDDQGLNEIPLNHHFKLLEFKLPNMQQWYDYIENKHEISPVVFEAFKRNIWSNSIFKYEVNSEVRISPRRLEEMFVYINQLYMSNVGISYVKEYIKISLRNYLNGKISSLYNTFEEIVEDIFVGSKVKLDWYDVLRNQLDMKIKIGSSRTYTPCLSGKPGVGKTSIIKKIAKDFNMNVIDIDCSPLNPEDTIGIPNVKKEGEEATQEVFFTEPLLYSLIMAEYNKYKGDNEYNHILFLDEINRTTPTVFNSIRKLILDLQVNETYKLPKDIIIVAALNPYDEGTNELTPHLKDVLDIIPAPPMFNKNMDFIGTLKTAKILEDKYGINGKEYVSNLFKKLSLRFGSTEDELGGEQEGFEDKYFYYITMNNNVFYISPREMTVMSMNILYSIQSYLEEISYSQYERYTKEQYETYKNKMFEIIYDIFRENMGFIMMKHSIEKKEIDNSIKIYINHLLSNEVEVFMLLENIYSEVNISIKSMLENIDYDIENMSKNEFVFNVNNYIKSKDSVEEVVNEFTEILDYVISKKQFSKYSALYEYYLDFFNIIKELDFHNFENQLVDRLMTVFSIKYKEIIEKIKVKENMHEIISEIVKSKVLKKNKFKDLHPKDDENKIEFKVRA